MTKFRSGLRRTLRCLLAATAWCALSAPAMAALTLTVNSAADMVDAAPGNGACATAAGKCTLRAAIQEANAWPGKDLIKVPAGTYRLTLGGSGETKSATGDLNITQSVEIKGAGAGKTIVDGNVCADPDAPSCTSDSAGSKNDRVMSVLNNGSNPNVTLSALTIQNGGGSLVDGGGLFVESGATVKLSRVRVRKNKARQFGGGLSVAGTVTVVESAIVGNSLPIHSLGGVTASGGGVFIFTGGEVTLLRSLVAQNEAAHGGGVRNVAGRLTVTNSTISDNHATGGGGGILNFGQTSIAFSTIAFNEANRQIPHDGNETRVGGGIYHVESTGANKVVSYLRIGASIVAGNTTNTYGLEPNHSPDCYTEAGASLQSVSRNVIGILNGKCKVTSLFPFSLPDDLAGGDDAPLNAKLGGLASNGGPTQTHALLAGSPAIDQASSLAGTAYQCPGLDQRRFFRPDPSGKGKCDVGAYEFGSSAAD